MKIYRDVPWHITRLLLLAALLCFFILTKTGRCQLIVHPPEDSLRLDAPTTKERQTVVFTISNAQDRRCIISDVAIPVSYIAHSAGGSDTLEPYGSRWDTLTALRYYADTKRVPICISSDDAGGIHCFFVNCAAGLNPPETGVATVPGIWEQTGESAFNLRGAPADTTRSGIYFIHRGGTVRGKVVVR